MDETIAQLTEIIDTALCSRCGIPPMITRLPAVNTSQHVAFARWAVGCIACSRREEDVHLMAAARAWKDRA